MQERKMIADMRNVDVSVFTRPKSDTKLQIEGTVSSFNVDPNPENMQVLTTQNASIFREN